MTQQIVITFLTTFISLLVFYLGKNYLPSYFGEKGKNQATKEDIGDITKIVENIKNDLVQQNELLKAELSITNQHRLNIKSAEREALLDFNARISAWIYSVLRFTLSNYNLENYKDLKTVSLNFSNRQYECDLAEAHLVLFMHDKEFLELKKDLTISVIRLQGIVEKAMQESYYLLSECEFKLELVKNNLGEQSKIRGKMYSDLNPILADHRTDTTNEYEKVHRLHYDMTQLINRRFKTINE